MHFLLGDLVSLSGQMKHIIPPGISGSIVLNQLSLSGRCSKEASGSILSRCLDHISRIRAQPPSRGNISGACGCTILCFWSPLKDDKCELEFTLIGRSQPSPAQLPLLHHDPGHAPNHLCTSCSSLMETNLKPTIQNHDRVSKCSGCSDKTKSTVLTSVMNVSTSLTLRHICTDQGSFSQRARLVCSSQMSVLTI